ncbi:hypothetical protein KAH37_05990, partial [bacterium]|nr:hypothetical protein [bacterium]
MRRLIVLFLALLFIFNLSAKKGDSTTAIPDVLKPWQEWVMYGFEPQLCPSSFDDLNATKCSWSSPLELKITNSRAQFSQSWTLYADSWITLPGSVEQWPKQVLSSGKPLLITKKSELPAIFLKKGVHHIKGVIEWESRPESLLIPTITPFISLTVDGKKVESVNRDKAGMLWFTTKTKVVESTDEVKISVFRNVVDEIPLIIASEIHLSVSGKEREITIGRFLPENSVAMKLNSALPAKIEKDGNIKIRIKAGKWKIRLLSRQNSFVNSFNMKKNTKNWPNQEVWVFSANSSLRDASVTGVVSIDTSQTNIPQEWKSLPAFLVTEKVSFTIKEEMRGDSHPAPDQIGISRTFWLDFDGQGFTVKDSVAGILNKNRRLEMSDGYKMGSVSVAGRPQLITKIGDKNEAIELRQGRLDLHALGRYTTVSGDIPATGWSTDVTDLSAVVNLPPGWSVLYATGVDTITNSWVEKWTVWDMFLLFIIAVLVSKLMTKGWGIVAFLTILITYHDSSAPLVSWFVVAALLGLLKIIPEDKFEGFRRFTTKIIYLSLA